jgi:hypothetical protein
MSVTDSFVAAWDALKQERQRLIDDVARIRSMLSNLRDDRSMRQLLDEKDDLQRRLPDMRGAVEAIAFSGKSVHEALRDRRRALADPRLQAEIARRLQSRRDRLVQLESIRAPASIIARERELIFELEAPIPEVEALFERKQREEVEGQDAARVALDTALQRIASIEAHYRETKRCLEQELQAADARRLAHAGIMMEWATQSAAHLEWIIAQDPMRKSDMLRRFRQRFPDEDTSAFQDQPMPLMAEKKPDACKRAPQPLSVPPQEAEPAPPEPWTFSVTFRPDDAGKVLPATEQEFVQSLHDAVSNADYRGLDPKLAYEKLMAVAGMAKQHRQEIRKVTDGPWLGWKVLRVGKKHRLFLAVDEERRNIRFVPQRRKTAYQGH